MATFTSGTSDPTLMFLRTCGTHQIYVANERTIKKKKKQTESNNLWTPFSGECHSVYFMFLLLNVLKNDKPPLITGSCAFNWTNWTNSRVRAGRSLPLFRWPPAKQHTACLYESWAVRLWQHGREQTSACVMMLLNERDLSCHWLLITVCALSVCHYNL